MDKYIPGFHSRSGAHMRGGPTDTSCPDDDDDDDDLNLKVCDLICFFVFRKNTQ